MTTSRREPKPVPVRRYRYSKLRWRLLVHALDAVGAVLAWIWRRLAPRRPKADPRRILLAQLDHLGDAVLSSPLLPRLRLAYPGASIDVLASSSNREVFEADPLVSRVIVADRNWFERRPRTFAMGSAVWALGRRLRAERYDLGIDVRGDVLTVLVLAIAGISRRLGWAMGGGGFLLTDVADWVPGRHEVASRLALLDKLGIAEDGPTRVVVHATDGDRARVARLLRDAWPDRPPRRSGRTWFAGQARKFARVAAPATPAVDLIASTTLDRRGVDRSADRLHAGRFGSAPLLAVHVGAGTAAKRWPPGHWRDLVARFLADGWRVIVVGAEEDAGASSCLEPHPDLRDWTGRLALTETAALLERADLFIGADSGPAHIAASAGVASVILFSGTNLIRQWRPWSRRSLVLRRRVPCRPCHRKTCPLADHPCLNGITPDRVYRASKRWWARLHGQESPHAPI